MADVDMSSDVGGVPLLIQDAAVFYEFGKNSFSSFHTILERLDATTHRDKATFKDIYIHT